MPLVVLCVEDAAAPKATIERAQAYLATRGVEAAFVRAEGPVAAAILVTAADRACDLILMGGYGHGPVLEAVLGGAVDQVLRESRWPVLICR